MWERWARIFRFDPLAKDPAGTLEVVVTGLPDNKLHYNRHPLTHFLFDQDGDLLVNVGAPTDHCVPRGGVGQGAAVHSRGGRGGQGRHPPLRLPGRRSLGRATPKVACSRIAQLAGAHPARIRNAVAGREQLRHAGDRRSSVRRNQCDPARRELRLALLRGHGPAHARPGSIPALRLQLRRRIRNPCCCFRRTRRHSARRITTEPCSQGSAENCS